MTKIANKDYCNSLSSGLFLGDLIAECPTYKEINETDKFNVSGTYEDNQLVKKSDLSLYTGKTINHCTAWGEWDLTHYSGTTSIQKDELWLKFHLSFLNPPDVNLTIRFNYTVSYWPNGMPESTDNMVPNKTNDYTTLSYSASTQDYAISSNVFRTLFGDNINGNPIFKEVVIDSVTITPASTSIYNYIVNIKPIELNFHQLLAADASIEILSYQDDTTKKIETCQVRATFNFSTPTGTSLINNYNASVILDDTDSTNFKIGQSVETSKTSKSIAYIFNAIDYYGLRGYKLPYFKTKLYVSGVYSLYFYAQWNPRTPNTGIELTSLITEE